MRKKFTFIKNLILAVASALTLVAVSFAWFSNSDKTVVPSITGEVDNPTYASVLYFTNDNGNYSRLTGDINLKDWTPGSFKKYRMVVTTTTDEPLKLGMSIEGLSEINSDLKNSVQVKYTVYKAAKTTVNGVVSFNDERMLFGSDYMRLSELSDGKIFDGRSLASYQSARNDIFTIHYEIGLAADSPSTIEGMRSSLGTLKINIQPVT